jgi:predicted DNA-binding protein with PD1-like motif
MKLKKFGNKWVIRIDKGEEIVETVTQLCKKNKIKLGSVSGVGGTGRVTVGSFKAYY